MVCQANQSLALGMSVSARTKLETVKLVRAWDGMRASLLRGVERRLDPAFCGRGVSPLTSQNHGCLIMVKPCHTIITQSRVHVFP